MSEKMEKYDMTSYRTPDSHHSWTESGFRYRIGADIWGSTFRFNEADKSQS